MQLSLAALAVLLPIVAQAANFDVAVGQEGLTFTPPNVPAVPGDTVTFTFYPKNHTVTQSSFAAPCTPLEGGEHSGFRPTEAGPLEDTFVFDVTSADPAWFYCAQGQHCQGGMVFAVNPPAEGNTYETFVANAAAAESGPLPEGPEGGAPPAGPSGGDTSAGPSAPGPRPTPSGSAPGGNAPSGSGPNAPPATRPAGAEKFAVPAGGLLAGLIAAVVAL
ncbi:hypothetical protein FA15DRAFT_651700 [Coprinopsis marcescibilis]|uniref:Cupredoxin n=1 Tax=Coprinopsis marcescibilis TaxID=230819 RepID=A0A5C3LC59_COPMA|nr:hypothetical protein FA15DRAFT_651700 [Coprinopsis marcescibilis]